MPGTHRHLLFSNCILGFSIYIIFIAKSFRHQLALVLTFRCIFHLKRICAYKSTHVILKLNIAGLPTNQKYITVDFGGVDMRCW